MIELWHWAVALAAVAWLAAGLALGTAYFLSLRWTSDRLANGRGTGLSIGMVLGRLALLGMVLALIAREGTLPLLMTALGIFIARALVLRAARAEPAMTSPLASAALFHCGPIPITAAVLVTWAIMAVLVLGAMAITRRLRPDASPIQSTAEMVVEAVDSQIRDTMAMEPGPYRAFIGTLFIFIFVANWSTLIPGIAPPTAHLETDAALAALVFVAVIWFGIRAGGLRGYLATFATPSLVMVPINIIESISRCFSLLVRLFGNVMSGVFVVGIVLSLAGLLVPIPLMALDLLTGAVQAYIFAILAMVFIAGGIAETAPIASPSHESKSP